MVVSQSAIGLIWSVAEMRRLDRRTAGTRRAGGTNSRDYSPLTKALGFLCLGYQALEGPSSPFIGEPDAFVILACGD